MRKVYLAIGNRELETYFKENYGKELQFVGEAVYREGVVRGIGQTRPDVVVIRDALHGTYDFTKLISDIRIHYPDVRVIFIGNERNDGFYGTLVSYGVYDLIVGGTVDSNAIYRKIMTPSNYSDVKQFVPLTPDPSNYDETTMGTEIEFIDDEMPEVAVEDEIVETTGSVPGFLTKIKRITENIPQINLPKKVQKNEPETEPDTHRGPVVNDRVITFIGGRSGVGVTTLAVNTAFDLASMGAKVLYLEINRAHPAATHWFDTNIKDKGIDTASLALKNHNFKDVHNAIVQSMDLKKNRGPMKSNYKKFPNGLDFISYSGDYLFDKDSRKDLPALKELYLYALYQGGYDFVVIDLSHSATKRDIYDAILYSNRVFTVINQDISTISYHLAMIKNLSHEGIHIDDKNTYIINNYTPSKFSIKEIKEWVKNSRILTVPHSMAELSDSNYLGLPTVLHHKGSDFTQSVKAISKTIGGK